jgi:hypothetical protein
LYSVFKNIEKENKMKKWFAAHILTTDNLTLEEDMPISNSDFAISISLIIGALAIFGIIIHVLGA